MAAVMDHGRGKWLVIALLTTIPLTAILHHAIFFSPSCMLNAFGPDYSSDVVAAWLRSDPSLPLGAAAALVIYQVGRYVTRLRVWILAFVIAFLPLSVWIWDIPFTGRAICHLFHDGRLLHTRYLYMAAAVMYVPIALWLRHSRLCHRL